MTRANVITRWLLLVPGCAMPLAFAAWNTLSAQELVGVAAGVATWTVVMIRLHVWRLVDGEHGETTRLTASAACFMALQGLFVASTPQLALFVFYSPAAILGATVFRPLPLADPAIAFLITLACGGQALACVLSIQWATGRLLRHFNREK